MMKLLETSHLAKPRQLETTGATACGTAPNIFASANASSVPNIFGGNAGLNETSGSCACGSFGGSSSGGSSSCGGGSTVAVA